MPEVSWRRALKISAYWVAGTVAAYVTAIAVVRFLLMQEFLFLVVLPTTGLLLAWISPLALGQFYRSWKVAWLSLVFFLVAAPLVLALVFGVFFAYASPR
jgi:hypothetical protein